MPIHDFDFGQNGNFAVKRTPVTAYLVPKQSVPRPAEPTLRPNW